MALPKDWSAKMLGWELRMSRRGNVIAYAPLGSGYAPLPDSTVSMIKSHGHKLICHGAKLARRVAGYQGMVTGRSVSKDANIQEVVR